jgi:hypothetical protein
MRLAYILPIATLALACGSIADSGGSDGGGSGGDGGNVVVPVCDGANDVTVNNFKGGPASESLSFGGDPIVRTLSLPTNANVSIATMQLAGDSNPMAGNNKGAISLTTPNRASQIFALPGDHGTSYWYGRFDDPNLMQMNWDGTPEGTTMDLQTALPRVFGCDADDQHIYCVTSSDPTAAIDTAVDQLMHDGSLVKTFLASYSMIADQIRTPQTDVIGPGSFGAYGIAVGDDAVYLSGNDTSGIGHLEKYNKSTAALEAQVTNASAGTFSGMAFSKRVGKISLDNNVTADCSAGCVFTAYWGGSMDKPDRITVFDKDLNRLGVLDFGDGLIRDAGLMVSNIAPDGRKVRAAFWIGHFMDPAITTYTQVAEFPSNPTLEIGAIDGTPEWSFTGNLNQAVGSGDLSAGINAALNGGACDCTGCAIAGDNCEIPFTFDTAGGGSYTYSDVIITFACTE